MISRLGTEASLDAPELLASLSQRIADDPVEQQRLSHRSRQPRVLDLHLVPQLALADVQGVFPMLDSQYPVDWKQQIRQLRNSIVHQAQEVQGREGYSLKVISLLALAARSPRRSVAANLAFALAAMEDSRVLYVDGKGTAADLQLEDAGGLCMAAQAHREDLPACFRRVAGTQLYLLPYGRPSLEPEPVNPRGLQRLLDGLRAQFDWVVIDGPSFETPADASLFSFCSDGALYLVAREQDSFADLRAALRLSQSRYILGAVTV
jgi:Mrp family chromosome partitioning ATPase